MLQNLGVALWNMLIPVMESRPSYRTHVRNESEDASLCF